jgi:hypothetical protein
MRETYLEHRTCESVARICDVAWGTVEKYRVEGEWDKLCDRVDRLAEDRAVQKVSKRRADNIKIAQAYIIKTAKDMGTHDSIPFDPAAHDRMSRLVEFLSGDSDSRHSIKLDDATPEQIQAALDKLSTDQLRAMLNRRSTGSVDPSDTSKA